MPGNVVGVTGHLRTTAERGLGPGTPGWVCLNHLDDCQQRAVGAVPDDDQGNWIMKIVLAALAAFVVTGTTAAPAATIEGQATIVDGDTVKVNGIPVRLKGVDAPEMGDRYGTEATRGMQAAGCAVS